MCFLLFDSVVQNAVEYFSTMWFIHRHIQENMFEPQYDNAGNIVWSNPNRESKGSTSHRLTKFEPQYGNAGDLIWSNRESKGSPTCRFTNYVVTCEIKLQSRTSSLTTFLVQLPEAIMWTASFYQYAIMQFIEACHWKYKSSHCFR